jgi:quercetin dioxygenase-like cupin family protein
MGFEVYDYHTTNRNVLVSPEIRARLYHMAPGQVDIRHSHDLGHEIFLILEGLAEFEIEGETRQLGPGQLCLARADQLHQVRNLLPDRPTIMYLSVTPHLQPTHTIWADEAHKAPPRFRPNQGYDDVAAEDRPTLGLAEAYQAALTQLAETLAEAVQQQQQQLDTFKRAVAAGQVVTALAARDEMWAALYPLFKSVSALGQAWNDFTGRTAEDDFLAEERI